MEFRYALMFLMNAIKSFMGEIVHPWDAFGFTTTWYEFAMLLLFLFLLSFLSITTHHQSCIQLRFDKFSGVVFVSFVFSIVLPPMPCWIYLVLVWFSTFQIISGMIQASLQCLETNLRRIPAYNVNFAADIHDSEAQV